MTVLLNGLPATSTTLTIPGTGPWVADIDIDLPVTGIVPSGRVVITIGTESLTGTVDSRFTGRMGGKAHVQVVAGSGAWDQIVPAMHMHNDAGITSLTVLSVTAASIGEVVADPSPRSLGVDYVRTAGPASRVLASLPWYVDAAGVTTVGARPSRPAAPAVQVIEWDPDTRRAVLASEAIVWPGTVLTDARFDTATVRDVEQTFDASGPRVVAWCELSAARPEETAGSRLAKALGALARESVRLPYLRSYRYRVVLQGPDGRLALQSVDPSSEVPDALIAVGIWPGIAGVTQDLALGSVVLVAFIAGDPSMPIVVAFDPASSPPTAIHVAGGTDPVLRRTDAVTTWFDAVSTALHLTTPSDLAATALFTR